MRNFRNMLIWKNGLNLVNKIYRLSKSLPDRETYGLISQITRSAVSIPSNIAEGCGRKSTKEFTRFLEISLGSAYELETQLLVIEQNFQIHKDELQIIIKDVIELQKLISTYIHSIN
jgi:four helix bundle protein